MSDFPEFRFKKISVKKSLAKASFDKEFNLKKSFTKKSFDKEFNFIKFYFFVSHRDSLSSPALFTALCTASLTVSTKP